MQCTLFIAVVLLSGRCLADQSTFDCKMRELALECAHKIQPWLSDLKFQEIADALNGAKKLRIVVSPFIDKYHSCQNLPVSLSFMKPLFWWTLTKGVTLTLAQWVILSRLSQEH